MSSHRYCQQATSRAPTPPRAAAGNSQRYGSGPRAGSDDPPVASLGYITSSYHSVALGRSIAMANIENGAARQGETVYAFAHGKTYAATISSTNFVDPAGERQNA